MPPFVSDSLSYTLPSNVTQEQLTTHTNFTVWFRTTTHSLSLQSSPSHPFHKNPYTLHAIRITAANYWQGRLGFLLVDADIRNASDEKLPGVAFLKGGSVAVLLILQVGDDEGYNECAQQRQQHQSRDQEGNHENSEKVEEYAVLTIQPRYATGSLAFVEIPAGMIEAYEHDGDSRQTLKGTAIREIQEETGIEIHSTDLINLSDLALQSSDTGSVAVNESMPCNGGEENLYQGVHSSPGMSDDYNAVFMVRKTMSRAEIDELRGRHTGLANEGEKITLKIVEMKKLWREVARDGKSLAALALYWGLKGEGLI